MKFAVIQLHDKTERIKRDYVLTEENPLARLDKDGNKIVLNENIDCELAAEPVKFMSIKDILDEYTRQEIIWLQSPEIIKQMDKCLAQFKKVESMVNDAAYDKAQQQIDFGLKSLNFTVETENDAVDPFATYHAPKLSKQEWDVVCKTAYQFAREYKDKDKVLGELWKEGFTHDYYKEIAWIYVDFINKVHDKAFCEERMADLRKRHIKHRQ